VCRAAHGKAGHTVQLPWETANGTVCATASPDAPGAFGINQTKPSGGTVQSACVSPQVDKHRRKKVLQEVYYAPGVGGLHEAHELLVRDGALQLVCRQRQRGQPRRRHRFAVNRVCLELQHLPRHKCKVGK